MAKLKVVRKNKGSTVCETKGGKKVVLLTPSGKFKRYGRELSAGRNSRTGEKLSNAAAGYRMGYRDALGEQAKIYNKKHS